ncbi:hypothetical protein EYZ11_000609 [Aspergillus tanneri]|uniref:Uncharacterized protein n=1 Tax=Aspergillus tanneri TaxID=1220188 RepID=A0A4S3JWP2_9EURO|nr:uncharacterized protein ATNIH1004_007665 [Aspergillus tanneri]KAA8646238.1 hypothetical protein ATNIH1004_007665 [Aspergillus tanneri]THC99911.1 hypothetical protein EYZ11_000609 [Aspergillus tanneri]
MADGLNQARALRLAEIMNDYRTLLLHIPQQNVQVPAEDYYEEGYVVLRESLAAAQNLLSSNYCPSMPSMQAANAETEKAELQRVILDGSARRFQAHKIYLRAAAAKRWAMHRANVLRGQRPGPQHAAQLKAVSNTFRQELVQVTDQHVVADLRAADVRAGHWVNDDPSLGVILQWIRSHP